MDGKTTFECMCRQYTKWISDRPELRIEMCGAHYQEVQRQANDLATAQADKQFELGRAAGLAEALKTVALRLEAVAPRESVKPRYIGDGVYVSVDNGTLKLTTGPHEIWLEVEVMDQLVSYYEQAKNYYAEARRVAAAGK